MAATRTFTALPSLTATTDLQMTPHLLAEESFTIIIPASLNIASRAWRRTAIVNPQLQRRQ